MNKGWLDKKHYSKAKNAHIILSGNQYFAELEQIINSSKSELYIQMYILDFDTTGKRIIESLKKASARGVQVYLLLDAYGSKSISNNVITDLKNNGINFRWYSPLFKKLKLKLGRRLHNKLIVADKNVALIGGINIADKYQDTPMGRGWLDFAAVVEGRIAAELHEYALMIWSKNIRRSRTYYKLTEEEILVRFRENDWLRNKADITKSYIHAIKNAQESITVIGAYFLPGRVARNLIKKASKKGIKIKIIVSGISDVRFIVAAQRYFYQWLFNNNVEIYEWSDSVVHGKVAIVDNKWLTIGSFNLNYLSVYGNIELNIDIFNNIIAENFNKHIESEIIPKCEHIVQTNYYKADNTIKMFHRWISYQIIRISMITAVYFFRRNKK
ncbi:MAG: phospholipase D-like domain-containing protein [Bacteroidota bacterium]